MTDYIPFNKPSITKKGLSYIEQAIQQCHISGDGSFSKKCEEWFMNKLSCNKVLLTGSCTHALEIAALLLKLEPGDEIIMPSYTFVSTANAFVLHGGVPVFIDINPDTMNIDSNLIQAAITKKTKAIVIMHYGGIACNMVEIIKIANKHNLTIIEDAAQALMSTYKNKYLGTFGHLSTFSFHETKNYTSGEGGALIINDPKYIKRAEIIRNKGTNRKDFLNGQISKYSWVDIGSSYIMSEINAAYLFSQLEIAEQINSKRSNIWKKYHQNLLPLVKAGLIDIQHIPDNCKHNGHLFYIKLKDNTQRTEFITFLEKQNINSVFHYVPLHDSPAGKKYGRFHNQDVWTSKESSRLARLPLYYNLTDTEQNQIILHILEFFRHC